jgi:GTPase SAR1 family protein
MSAHLVTPQPVPASIPSFEDILDAHLGQEMLRFTTAGSVDDGKSTLIGRLLHDTKSVYEDQLLAVKKSRVNRAANGHVDFSLLTDGLKAEREQGITIDVAYRYFATARRKFIIADTPGHEQYTRNMATGASTADVAIILIDARAFAKAGSLLPQSAVTPTSPPSWASRTSSPRSTRWTWSATRRRASTRSDASSRPSAPS